LVGEREDGGRGANNPFESQNTRPLVSIDHDTGNPVISQANMSYDSGNGDSGSNNYQNTHSPSFFVPNTDDSGNGDSGGGSVDKRDRYLWDALAGGMPITTISGLSHKDKNTVIDVITLHDPIAGTVLDDDFNDNPIETILDPFDFF